MQSYLYAQRHVLALLLSFSICHLCASDNHPIYKDYHIACAESADAVQSINLFSASAKKSGPITGKISYVEYLDLNEIAFDQIEKEKPSFIDIDVEFKGVKNTLKLHKVSLGNYKLLNAQNEELTPNPNLVFYRGYIEGSSSSFVTGSFLDDRVKIVFSNGRGNRTIYKEGQEYLAYADQDHLADKSFECGAEKLYDTKIDKKEELNTDTSNRSFTGSCVEVYIEADNQSYIDNNSSITDTEAWVTMIFNDVGSLYTAESIPTGISVIKVWDTVDPYATSGGTGAMLTAFRNQNTTFTGALAHLFSTRSVGGGVAYLDVLCSTFNYAVSGSMSSTYSTYPNYSWNVNVVAHEMGHNMGSEHTHDCVWNGNNTQIDDCGHVAGYDTSNSCWNSASPILPTSGTIMSYCHLLNGFGGTQNIGIDFANGFGPLPGALMLGKYTGATCNTGACSGTGPSCADGIQNGDETGVDCGGTLCSACPAPSNDDCAGAMDMSSFLNVGVQTFTAANDLATSSGTGPINQVFGQECNTHSSWCNYTINNDIWYKVDIPSSGVEFGVMTVDLLGSTYDTQLAIYTNCAGNEIAANDDYHGNSNNWTSKVSAAVLPGNTYYIQVDGFNNGSTGNLSMDISYTPITGPVDYNGGTVQADVEAPDELGNTHYVHIASGKALLSLKKNGQDIGWLDIDAGFSCEVKANAGSVNLGTNGCTAPYTNNTDWYVMRRTWDLTPTTQPSNPILVKTYYTALDFNQVANNLPDVNTHTDLTHYKISSPGNEDLTAAGNNCHETVSLTNYTEYENTDYTYGLFNSDHYAEYAVTSFSGGGGGGGASAQGALPIELIRFEAEAVGSYNRVNWSTASEINNAYQMVQKSLNGDQWLDLEKVESVEDKTTESNYEVRDQLPYLKTYYRLMSMDLDGSVQYSTVVSVSRGNIETTTRSFPNPTNGITTISSPLLMDNADNVEIILYDLQGKQYTLGDYDIKLVNATTLDLDISKLAAGIYPLVIKNGNLQEIIKISKF